MPREKKKLGAWFPKASVIKGASYDPEVVKSISLLLFYQYAEPMWSDARKVAAVARVEAAAQRLNLGGRVRVANEGLNATVSGPAEAVRGLAVDLAAFDPCFAATDWKYVDGLPLDRAFTDLKVLPVQELVFYGLGAGGGALASGQLGSKGGVHLEPREYHAKLSAPGEDTVVVDVRNAYESDIGRFGGQAGTGGAELLDPGMRKSTDFPTWLARPDVKKKLHGKEILM